jgi:hypothetical protein
MRPIQKAFYEHVAKLPRMALRPILKRKLKEQGISISKKAFEALLDHLLCEKGGQFTWSDEKGEAVNEFEELKLIFDDADAKEIENFTERIRLAVPGVIQSVVDEGGTELFEAMIESWNIDDTVAQFEIGEFRERLEDRWGAGLHLLRLLLTTSREMGEDATKRYRKSKSKTLARRRFVLSRLHIRACQIAEEIVSLMENGFADGAMARWRTLHEIGVVATFIEDGDEELARRFIDHDIVEVKKQADDWDSKQVPLGYPPINSRERKKIEKAYADALNRYGQTFRHDYGWAADYLQDKKPDFQKLQAAAEQSGMNAYYKLANLSVHAGSRSMFFRLTDMGADVPIAGRSNAGLVEPGQNTAYTLVRITGALLGRPRDIDRLVEMRALIAVRDAIPRGLHLSDKRLRRDEAKIRRELKGKQTHKR